MRYATAAAWVALSFITSVSAAESNKAQREKIDRCSNAAFLAVSVIEMNADASKQPDLLLGAFKALKANPAIGKTMPYEGEVVGAYTVALKVAESMQRPFDARKHDWLIAQSASACTLWVPHPQEG
ncbi:hypothetical protein [Pseudomonas putida]|uniref:hypothetical protein n=1 Tax=Pseudomonas putida TaxID=303 RepID=UPI0021196B02|nr:hypothetical protein [Pseudomonas putida]